MDLSIVIVNYNVKYFLEQCLHSVNKAIKGIECEVFVVDNNSVDGSCAHIREKFPWVQLIENKENLGFSKANNQAIRLATGKYILLLNPDTVVEEDTFSKCIDFMDEHPDGGGLGVKMIDGRGHFLPESKRALPTPMVAFYKIFGFSSLFPKSKRFAKYHLGYLDKEKVHEVDVLSGAYMFLRKETIDKSGMLDEDYFMYGEDIDLSYRITKAGYKNYYCPDTTIIHYKGESTKKGSLNYVMVFYNAMIIFAKKHFSSRNARYYSMVINLAIYLRAALSLGKRFILKIYRQLIDAILIFSGFLFGTPLWESLRFGSENYYSDKYFYLAVPGYILVWIISAYYSGGYDKPARILKYVRGISIGTLIILVIYALLPESMRFSRALILLGTAWTLVSTGAMRWVLHLLKVKEYRMELNKKKRIVIVGEENEAERVKLLLQQTQINPEILGVICPGDDKDKRYIGSLKQLGEIVRIHKLDEVLFCSENISSQEIISIMAKLTETNIDFKIAPPESMSIIGSNSINTSGDLYTINFNSIGKESNRRSKRLFDLFFSGILLLSFPIWMLAIKKPFRAFLNLFQVVLGLKTMVGYYTGDGVDLSELPKLRKNILSPLPALKEMNNEESIHDKINMVYAKDYKVTTDFQILWKGFPQLGK